MFVFAFLLNIHETLLADIEAGVVLPSDDVLARMQLIGISLGSSVIEAEYNNIDSLEQAVYCSVRDLPAKRRRELNDDLGFYLSCKRMFGEVIPRRSVLQGLCCAIRKREDTVGKSWFITN